MKNNLRVSNLRGGVSSDTMIAIGPVSPPHPFASEVFTSWKDHHWNSARFITISALTVFTCKWTISDWSSIKVNDVISWL